MQWQVALNNDSFDRAGITKDCQDAVCEYIWNSFEAGASKVTVSMMGSPLQEAMSLVVADNGMGIAFDNLDKTFGTFLSSLKNNATLRLKSQSNKGKGRFSYLSFSHSAEWHTVYRADSKLKQYTISTNSASRSQFDTTEPVDVIDETETGTTVTFSLEDSNTADLLSFGVMKQKLLEEFAWYLFLNKDKGYVLEYTGISLDISEYIRTDLSRNCLCKIGSHDFSIDVVVWNSSVSNSSKIYYRTEKGEIAATQNTSFNKNTVKFYAVCAEVEDDVKVKYKNFEHHGKKGLVDIIENFELYALSWDDIFQAFEARHSFLLGKLKLDYSQVEAELGVAGKPPASKADVNALTQKLVAINA